MTEKVAFEGNIEFKGDNDSECMGYQVTFTCIYVLIYSGRTHAHAHAHTDTHELEIQLVSRRRPCVCNSRSLITISQGQLWSTILVVCIVLGCVYLLVNNYFVAFLKPAL